MPEGRTWKRIAIGGVEANPGSTERIQTGAWRSERPIVDFDRCTHCMICWIDCPDACFNVNVDAEKLTGVDLLHCKGCGICASVCPAKCIEMVSEVEAVKVVPR